MSSSRRTSGEIHILAMLDGQTTGKLTRRFLALPAAFWYGAAAVVACILLAGLAWLVRAPLHGRSHPADVAAGPPAAPDAAQPSMSSPGPEAALPNDLADTAHAGVTTDPARDADAGAGARLVVAPMVPEAASPALTTTPAAATPHDPAAARMAHASAQPRQTVPAHAPAAPSPTSTSHPVQHGTIAHTAGPRTVIAQHAPPARSTNAARADAPAGRGSGKRQAGPSRAAPAAVDTDVALISAIIQHTSPRGDASDADTAPDCGDRGCPARMPNRQ